MAVTIGYYNPYASIVTMAPIALWFWALYFRYLYLFWNIEKHEKALVKGNQIKEKRKCSEDGKRIYIDCIEATFGLFLPFLVHRQKNAEVKVKLRKGSEVEVYRLGSIYVAHKGRFSFIPFLFPLISSLFAGVIVTDILKDLSS